MNPVDGPANKWTTSYADALRGHKAFVLKTKPPQEEKKVELAPIPRLAPKPQKTSPKKNRKGGHKAGSRKGTSKEGKESGHKSPQLKQPEKASQPKPSKSKVPAAVKPTSTPQMSYADAVKGMVSSRTLKPTNAKAPHAPESAEGASTSALDLEPDGIDLEDRNWGHDGVIGLDSAILHDRAIGHLRDSSNKAYSNDGLFCTTSQCPTYHDNFLWSWRRGYSCVTR
ncbi:hypothetical protein N0V88_004846 [Collariella sp. IMI 366227]|nr:hypothetical protein N0V88_004846 [Collariella sp. IMI 366227]